MEKYIHSGKYNKNYLFQRLVASVSWSIVRDFKIIKKYTTQTAMINTIIERIVGKQKLICII